jgi:hypothetical protein
MLRISTVSLACGERWQGTRVDLRRNTPCTGAVVKQAVDSCAVAHDGYRIMAQVFDA